MNLRQEPVRIPRRDEVVSHLQAAGIGAAVHHPMPLHLQPAWQHLGYRRGDLPVSEAYADGVVSLPMYPELTEAQIAEVAGRVKVVAGGS